jgi:hypothetical protein
MTFRTILALAAFVLATPLHGQGLPGLDIDGPFARVKRNEDGSVTTFERGNDKRSLTKVTKTPAGNITLKTIYRLDENGNPLRCDIYDGLGNKLYKTRFGYSKRQGPTFGKLVQELLYDVRVKRFFPGTKEEQPVHMFLYRYNADGSPQLPIGITLIKGKTAEEIFGRGISPEAQALPDLEELEEVDPANPSAQPVGR